MHKISAEEIAARTAKGAAWLDAVYPEWWTRIDLADLDLSNSCRCVLGQIGGGVVEFFYDFTESWLGGHDNDGASDFVVEHGFNFAFSTATVPQWAELDEAWIVEIKRRAEVGVL